MSALDPSAMFGPAAVVTRPPGPSPVLVVCEHASNHVPDAVDLGVGTEVLDSHVGWDPGAVGVARALSVRLSAGLVAGAVSRLVYDCNRPPESISAIPARSEVHDIPGNVDLTPNARQARIDGVFWPFTAALSGQIAAQLAHLRLLVTVHSFTPVFHGQPRAVEIGVLHGSDPSFARAMMDRAPEGFDIRLNAPYGPEDGVMHTLDTHGVANRLLNVMLEIRSDLITDEPAQTRMALRLAPWIETTLAALTQPKPTPPAQVQP